MSTVSSLSNGKLFAAVKGAPETIKGMLAHVPVGYDELYKGFTRKGSRVLALGMKEMENMSTEKVRLSVFGNVCGRWVADLLSVD